MLGRRRSSCLYDAFQFIIFQLLYSWDVFPFFFFIYISAKEPPQQFKDRNDNVLNDKVFFFLIKFFVFCFFIFFFVFYFFILERIEIEWSSYY